MSVRIPSESDRRGRRIAWSALPVALLAIGSAAVLVRSIPEVEPVAIAFWRTAAVGLLLAPALRRVSRRDAIGIALAGACLALHFSAWFTSLGLTSVLRSTVLVCTCPFFAAAFEWLGSGRNTARGRRFFAGSALGLVGVGLLVRPESASTDASLRGDALALSGAVLMGAYFAIGRRVRPRVGIGTYASGVCLVAAALLLAAAWLTNTPLAGYSSGSWLGLALLALGPQLLGHNGFNLALRHIEASTVGAVILLEPLVAGVLAGLVLDEWPGPLAALGGAIAVAGVAMATLERAPAAQE